MKARHTLSDEGECPYCDRLWEDCSCPDPEDQHEEEL